MIRPVSVPPTLLAILVSVGLASIGTTQLRADTVELSGGGHLTGKVKRLAGKKMVIVQVDDDIRVALPESRVRRVVMSSQLSQYEQRVIQAGDDAESHYQLGIWCVRTKDFPGDSNYYKQHHMRRAIELDPDHSDARASLGFTKEKGQWIRNVDLMRHRGMIRASGGGWQLPEAVALKDFRDRNDVASKKWIKEVKRLTAIVLRGSAKKAEALATLSAIDDPLAAEAIARQLKESRGKRVQGRDLRMLWIKLLDRFRNIISVEALVLAGIDEPDDYVREAALEKLKKYGWGSAVATYMPMLTSNSNSLVNRAARALSWFPDPELALSYVDALVTKHKTEIGGGPGMQVGIGGREGAGVGGVGGGMAMGGKKTVYIEHKQNPAVLGLLNTIEPDANYGYDEQSWRAHFAAKLTFYEGDLRRDP